MATIINNPPASDNSGGPIGMIVALVVLLFWLIWGTYMGFLHSNK